MCAGTASVCCCADRLGPACPFHFLAIHLLAIKTVFTEPDTWSGGSVELLVALGHMNDDDRLRAIQAVWAWPALQGPYGDCHIEPTGQVAATPGIEGRYYGLATLPNETGQVAFSTCFVEDDNGLWLYAGVPLGSLGTACPVGAFPFGEGGTQDWERTVYKWLFGLAKHLFNAIPFDRAVIGWLTTLEVDEIVRKTIPEVRRHAYIVAVGGRLECHAPNLDGALLS